MTETEFRSAHEQSKRTGIDSVSVNKMYELFNKVPSKYSDKFIDVVLFESAKKPDILEDGHEFNSDLVSFLDMVWFDPEDASLYDKVTYLPSESMFGVPEDRFNSIISNQSSLDSVSIGELMEVSTSDELMQKINSGEKKYKTYFNISPNASVRSVINFLEYDVFSIDLIPESDRDEFMSEAKKELNGGSNNHNYVNLFRYIGKDALSSLVYSNSFIGPDNSINYNGKYVGSFEVNDNGEITVDSNSAIVPFVVVNSGSRLVLNNPDI